MAKGDNKKGAKKQIEIGQSGTNIFSGIINEEYNPKLKDVTGINKYDEMRKSDGTVRAAITACQLPIRRANWFIEPASEDKKDIEIKEFVEKALFTEMSLTWDDFLRQALLMLPFGVMVFEKVFDIRNIDGTDRIIWKKFGPRMPTSITSWETEDGEKGIKQLPPNTGNEVSIPMEKLLVFVNEIEGENWWGTSMLRSAYKHWYIKTRLEQIDAVASERQGLGIPFVKLGQVYTEDDATQATKILKNLRANEQAYLVEPPDMTVEFKDMKASGVKDLMPSISYHNRQIILSVLAQFLDLGSGSSGSRALSSDHSDLFLQSLEAVAKAIADVINKYAIKELVDYNFDNVDYYPELNFNGISRVNADKLSTAYQRFAQAGGIKPTKSDAQYIREMMGLPESIEDEEMEVPQIPKTKDKEIKEDDLNQEPGKKKIENKEDIDSVLNRMSESERTKYIKQQHRKISIKEFSEQNDFESWRKMTFAEKKVNFDSIQKQMDKLEGELKEEGEKLLKEAKDDYLSKMTRALEKGDTKKIKELELKFNNKYASIINSILKKAYIFAKNNAAKEMGVKQPANNKQAINSINIASDTIASRHAEQVTSEAKTVLTRKMAQSDSVPDTIGAMDAVMVKAIQKVTRDTAQIVIAGHINLGRQTVFEANAEDIYALQRSELLDSKTCNFCLSIDGRIVEKDDSIARIGTFHSSCRGIWVEILQDEEEKPGISGIPNSIRDRIGDATNEILQPTKPIVKKNTPAEKEAKKREK